MVTIEQLFRQAQQAGAAEIYLMAGRKRQHGLVER